VAACVSGCVVCVLSAVRRATQCPPHCGLKYVGANIRYFNVNFNIGIWLIKGASVGKKKLWHYQDARCNEKKSILYSLIDRNTTSKDRELWNKSFVRVIDMHSYIYLHVIVIRSGLSFTLALQFRLHWSTNHQATFQSAVWFSLYSFQQNFHAD